MRRTSTQIHTRNSPGFTKIKIIRYQFSLIDYTNCVGGFDEYVVLLCVSVGVVVSDACFPEGLVK